MELVYLWVENYKNIHKQGFNFSPQFECDFFPVYEDNADGKEVLKENCKLEIKKNKDYVNIFPKNINITAIVGENGSGKSSILELLYKITNKSNEINIIVFFSNEKLIIFYQKKPEVIDDHLYEIVLNKKIEGYEISYINISHFQNEDIDIYDNNYYSIYNDIMYRYEDNEQNNKSNILNRYKNFKTQMNYFLIYQQDKLNYLEELIKPQKISLIKVDFLKNENLKDLFLATYHNLTINQLFYIIFSDEFPELFVNDNNQLDANTLSQFISSYSKSNKIIIDNFLSSSTLNEDHLIIKHSDIKKFITLINLADNKYEYFELTLLNKEEERIDLSSGEQLLLFYLIQIDMLNNIIMIDELDAYLHPQWQKEFLSLLLKFNKNKHFVLSSHSPFLLSDIPKNNIIFLKNGKQVKIDINTFGANIHSLLSHGFFMKNGLIGEFAKDKINKAITYLNQQKLSKDEINYCENIISIIGEPVIKNQLQRMLDSKRLSKLDEIDKLKDEMEQIKHKIEILSKKQ